MAKLRTPAQERALYNDLKVSEAADAMRVSQETVRKLIRKGALPATDVSAGSVPNYRIAVEDLDAFRRDRRTA